MAAILKTQIAKFGYGGTYGSAATSADIKFHFEKIQDGGDRHF